MKESIFLTLVYLLLTICTASSFFCCLYFFGAPAAGSYSEVRSYEKTAGYFFLVALICWIFFKMLIRYTIVIP